ncbi:hypothetical protein JAAARDRAFT_211836, partial [Jaapia argillacea MUCL 33604]
MPALPDFVSTYMVQVMSPSLVEDPVGDGKDMFVGFFARIWFWLQSCFSGFDLNVFRRIGDWIKDKGEVVLHWIQENKEMLILCGIILLVVILVVLVICVTPFLLVGIIQLIGFGAAGIVKGSFAAFYQATILGGLIAKGSLFAILQSIG